MAASRTLSRRDLLQRGAVLSLLPLAERVLVSAPAALAAPNLADGTLQAFADTLIPGKRAARTDLGNEIHPKAIAGADPEPGAVQADSLLLYHHPLIGFDLVEAAFLADLEARSLPRLGQFIDLPFAKRVAVCVDGLSPSNPTAQVWELAAYVRSMSGLVPSSAAPGRNDDMKGPPPENSAKPTPPKNTRIPS